MNTKLLIDAIVQQTTVLIAELSTASGIRAPLAHVAAYNAEHPPPEDAAVIASASVNQWSAVRSQEQ
jgi:hypothetical protein